MTSFTGTFYTPSFLGFSVYVSNTTNKSEGVVCFKDTNFTTRTIPPVITINCIVHGHYIIYYNERLPEVAYPEDYSKNAEADLCEVEVYGMCLLRMLPILHIKIICRPSSPIFRKTGFFSN